VELMSEEFVKPSYTTVYWPANRGWVKTRHRGRQEKDFGGRQEKNTWVRDSEHHRRVFDLKVELEIWVIFQPLKNLFMKDPKVFQPQRLYKPRDIRQTQQLPPICCYAVVGVLEANYRFGLLPCPENN
jgi:hypothetical protein